MRNCPKALMKSHVKSLASVRNEQEKYHLSSLEAYTGCAYMQWPTLAIYRHQTTSRIVYTTILVKTQLNR